MKKLLTLMLTLSLGVTLSACMGGAAGDAVSGDTSEVFRVGDYPILVTTPKGWEEESDPGSLDLQCISPNLDMYLSVYGFSKLDLAEDQATQNLFELQTDEVFSTRDNATEIEPISKTEDDERILYSALYSAERDGVKNYYQLFFIRFKSTDDMAWIMINGMPSVIEKNKETIDGIIEKVQNSDPEMFVEKITYFM